MGAGHGEGVRGGGGREWDGLSMGYGRVFVENRTTIQDRRSGETTT